MLTAEWSTERYEEEDNRRIMQTAAEVEYEGYLRWCRVREPIEFASRMGFHKIGIACKAGAVPKTEMGIDKKCCEIGVNSCNPILQAELLNKEKTEMNIVMGLCVGHDSLFYKYSDAIVTTLVTKDRVTGHNKRCRSVILCHEEKSEDVSEFPPYFLKICLSMIIAQTARNSSAVHWA